MLNPERQAIKKEQNQEREEAIRALIEVIKERTLELIKDQISEGLLDKNLRIDINQYKDIYSKEELQNDRDEIRRLESKFSQKNEGLIKSGETLEILKTYLFNKFRGDKFICVRTSKFDDYFRHVDNLIINKENEQIICAIDVTADINSENIKIKQSKVLMSNSIGGIWVRYSIKFERNKIIPSRTEIIPVILITLPESFLNKLLDLMVQQKKEEFDQNVSIFFNGIKTLIDLYILPPLEEELNIVRKSNLKRASIIESVIQKIESFKKSL